MGTKRMKATTIIIEYSLLFLFGIVILISSVATFNNYQVYFSSVGTSDQLGAVTEYVGSNIVSLAQMGGQEESSVVVKIPKRIGGSESYIMELYPGGLNTTSVTTNITKHSDLYGLGNSFAMKGRVVSGRGEVMIYKTGNQIIIS
ncbi:MAG TPA: hypothetical protein VJ485_00240 [archaeon]|jgi:hypothetical protein|nr:hypothetical protein [archaeon]